MARIGADGADRHESEGIMSEETHQEYETRQARLAAEQTDNAKALHAARATFWQSLAGSAVFTISFGQATTWGDLGAQGVAFAIAATGSTAAALIAAAAAYSRWRGGTPTDMN